jgi:DNA topoisomerase-2
MSNLVLFNREGLLKKYTTVNEILEEFFTTRIEFYKLRKDYLLSKYRNELEIL